MAQKKYDSDIVGWCTKGGKRIPIRKGTEKDKKKEALLERAKKAHGEGKMSNAEYREAMRTMGGSVVKKKGKK